MGRSQETFGKKDREKKKLQKRKNKESKKASKKENGTSGSLDDMIVYVDEFGNFVDTPPDQSSKKEVDEASIEISVPKSAPVNYDDQRTGKVAFFDTSKGYGFIQPVDLDERVYVHVSNLVDEISEGDKVTFKIEKGDRGLVAIDVMQAK